MTPINPTVALALSHLIAMLLLAKIWQFSMILMIRHFSVFYQNIMNSIDECFVKRLVRSFVGFISIISVLMSDVKNTLVYQQMIQKSEEPALHPKVLFISSLVCVIILIVTQYKIEMFKKSVDVKAKFDLLDEDENNQGSNSTNYKKNTVRIVLCLSSLGLFSIILIIGKSSIPEYIHWLIILSTLSFINIIVIPVIFIVRTENLYHFSQRQIIKIFQCCRK